MSTSFSKITVDSLSKALKGDLQQAQIRQTVTRTLPSTRTSNSLKDSLFSNEELGIKENIYTEERVAWIEVGKDATVETVQAALDKNPKAKLRRFLASQIILSDDQKLVATRGLSGEALESFNEKYAIPAGTAWGEEHVKFFLNNIADRQAVRYGENNTEGKSAEELVMFNGKQQFRRVEFSKIGEEDMDMRVTVEVRDIKELALAPTDNAIVAEPVK